MDQILLKKKYALECISNDSMRIIETNDSLRQLNDIELKLNKQGIQFTEADYYRSKLIEKRTILENNVSTNFKFLIGDLKPGDVLETETQKVIPFTLIRLTEKDIRSNALIFPILIKQNGKYTGETQLKILNLKSGEISDYGEINT